MLQSVAMGLVFPPSQWALQIRSTGCIKRDRDFVGRYGFSSFNAIMRFTWKTCSSTASMASRRWPILVKEPGVVRSIIMWYLRGGLVKYIAGMVIIPRQVLIRCLLLLAVLAPGGAYCEIYKWTDAQGNVHFGDSPQQPDQAEKVNIQVNSYRNVSYDNVEFFEGQRAQPSQKVVMYATSWCGYCKQARRYFKKYHIPYTEHDIEKDERARRMYDLLGGQGVPVILVGRRRMNGFSVAGFERIYN